MRLRRIPDFLPLVIAGAGALLLVLQWSQGRMLWLDEEMIAINIRDRSLAGLMGPLALGQAAPYGWLAVERLIFLAAGDGERALRFLPMACGVATLAAAAWIGRRWMRPAGAVSLAFLCAAGQWLSFHALELKHYSGDAFFGLLLPALAVWAVEPPAAGGGDRMRPGRVAAWWGVAALAQWVANGALFVAPACALVMIVVAMRRCGWRGAASVALPGAVWLAAFAANYAVALGPARASDFLASYWRGAFPAAGSDLAGTVRWLVDRIAPLAIKPAGSGFGWAFWAAALAGWLLAPGYSAAFRLAFALVPLSAFALAGVRLVPMFERLSLWIVPALYVGVAMAADGTEAMLRAARHRRSAPRAAGGLAAAGFLVALGADVYRRGTTYVELAPYAANHATDDRGAVRWLARQQQPGDVWVTTHNALPAIWWYAGAEPGPVFETMWHTDAADCGSDEIGARFAAARARRALVYLGFGHDTPVEFDDALVGRLAALGSISGYRLFGEDSHAVVVDLEDPPSRPLTLASLGGASVQASTPPGGCLTAQPGLRW